MPASSQYGNPRFIKDLTDQGSVMELKRVPFSPVGSQDSFDERWVQDLIRNQPSVMPIDQIEPAFVDLVPVCIELPITTGEQTVYLERVS